jgi:hypothetical protein
LKTFTASDHRFHPPHLDVRFTTESGHVQCTSGCPLCARSEHDAE